MERRSYSGQTCTEVGDITAGSVMGPVVALDSLQHTTIVGQSNYRVTHNHMNLDNCCSNSGNTYGRRPTSNSSRPY